MKVKTAFFYLFLLTLLSPVIKAQYFSNPNFEGNSPGPNVAPASWENCSGTPDTQPWVWSVPTAPSSGNSYMGMCWFPGYVEKVWTDLDTAFSASSCYHIELDLAFYHEINYYGSIENCYPITIEIYASSGYCNEGDLLWTSPYISNTEWETFDFVIDSDEDIGSITIKTNSEDTNPPPYSANIGYILVDNIVVESPPELDLGNDTTLCLSDTLVLFANSGFESYLWQDGSTDTTFVVVDTGYYWVEAMTDYGCSIIDSIHVGYYIDIDLGNDTIVMICQNGGFNISPGDEFVSYLWQDGSTGDSLWVDVSGTYWVEVISENGCSDIDTINVILEDYQEMTSEGVEGIEICEGFNVDIWVNVEGGVSPFYYEWSEGITDTVSTVNVSPVETTVYYATITDYCEEEITDSVEVIVNPLPIIELPEDTVLCEGGELILDVGEGFEYYFWSDGSTGQTFTVYEVGTYWVQVINEFACSSYQEIEVSLAPSIDLFLGNDTTLCVGDVLLIELEEGMVSYLWQDGSFNNYFEIVESGEYWVVVENETGCVETDTIEVEFDTALPEIDLGEDMQLCFGDEVLLDAGEHQSYEWQDGSIEQTYFVTEAGEYWVNVMGACGMASDTIVVQYFPEVTPDLGPDTTICYDDQYILDPGVFQSWLWQDGSTSPNFSVYETGTYSVVVTDINACEGSDEVFVRVGQEVDLVDESFICEGDTIVLTVSTDFDFYIWKNGNNDTLGIENSIEIYEEGIYYLFVGISDIDCNSMDSTIVSVMPLAKPMIADGEICEGDSLQLMVEEDNSFDYLWSDGSLDSQLWVSETGLYWVKVGNECAYAYDSATISVFPLPEVSIGEDYYFLENEEEEIVLDAGEGFATYLWQDGSDGTTYTVAFEDAILDSIFYVEVFDGNCYNRDSTIVEVFDVKVPILITPNGDGINDVFLPGEDWIGVKQHTIIVFNRWGQKIWESNDFPSGWDGRSRLGGKAPDGTYFWVLTVSYAQDLRKVFKGSLTILSGR